LSNDSTKQAVAKARAIQRDIDGKEPRDADHPVAAMQAGQRDYPTSFPEQHLPKPGNEDQLIPQPMYQAPSYKGSGKLNGKTALISGGDSGIGRAVAVLFAREGANIAIAYLDEDSDALTTKASVEAEGRVCILVPGDLATPAHCKQAVRNTIDEFGGLDILVVNAAYQQHATSITDISDAHFDQTVKTNLYGMFYLTRAAIPYMPAGGSIIMTGSITGINGSKELLDYAMTKGGIHAFARSLSSQLIEKGIRVNVVAPGPVWTPLNPSDRAADDVAHFGSQTAMKRAAQPEEIAPAFVFFAAPTCSSYLTGEVLPVIGGYDH
jgi:NAD(P)-dependent dehydrogenase (short-subunit alcohol dehydrogenase family)